VTEKTDSKNNCPILDFVQDKKSSKSRALNIAKGAKPGNIKKKTAIKNYAPQIGRFRNLTIRKVKRTLTDRQ